MIIITENVTKSLKQWFRDKSLSTIAANNVVIPSNDLITDTRGILLGAGQTQKLNDNIVINLLDYIYLVKAV